MKNAKELLEEFTAASFRDPKQAAEEVLAGRPGPTARRWLGPTAVIVFCLFAIDLFLVESYSLLSFDVPITAFVQQFNWGPLVYALELLNAALREGLREVDGRLSAELDQRPLDTLTAK